MSRTYRNTIRFFMGRNDSRKINYTRRMKYFQHYRDMFLEVGYYQPKTRHVKNIPTNRSDITCSAYYECDWMFKKNVT